MNNKQFLLLVANSFIKFLQTHARSNEKLKVLHGQVAADIEAKLGPKYSIKSLGLGAGKEGKMEGRYMQKTVDILISKADKDIASIGLKFVMNNYSQNSNNYFESMLGETANLRANKKKYFQIFILPETIPYYDKEGKITRWEKVTNNNINKYIALSKDNPDTFLHTPLKTLLFIVKLPESDLQKITTKKAYTKHHMAVYDQPIKIATSIKGDFGDTVVLNDYEGFMKKVVHYMKSI